MASIKNRKRPFQLGQRVHDLTDTSVVGTIFNIGRPHRTMAILLLPDGQKKSVYLENLACGLPYRRPHPLAAFIYRGYGLPD